MQNFILKFIKELNSPIPSISISISQAYCIKKERHDTLFINAFIQISIYPLYEVKFRTITCKEILGELKNSSDHNSKLIYLHKTLFNESFGKMMSVFLHELSHTLGHDDNSREFSDSLTVLIQKCIDNNKSVQKYSKEWSHLIKN